MIHLPINFRTTNKAAAVIGFLLLASCVGPARAQTYSPTTNYTTAWTADENPNGPWEYGYKATFLSSFTLFQKSTYTGNEGWYSTSDNNGGAPDVAYYPSAYLGGSGYGAPNIPAGSLEASGLGSTGDEYADILFNAPSKATYTIDAVFTGDQVGDDADIHILANGDDLFTSTILAQGATQTYDRSVSLLAGQDIEFLFGGNGDTALHPAIVGLDATITESPAPEASTLVCFFTVLGLFLCVVTVRKKQQIAV